MDMFIKNKPAQYINRLPLLLLTVIILWSCDRSRTDKGREYFPDMAHSKAYKTYTVNPATPNGQTMQKPVEGTIPRDVVPYRYYEFDKNEERPGKELVNPHDINQKVLDEGKYLYGIFCQQCHGENGDGKGHLYTSGKYTVPPRSLIEQSVLDQNGGQIYHTISHGYGVMGQHASLIRPEDRWKIVAYVEKMIQKK
ncbi:MAG: cytochrome c [Bacteroidales bacterium]|nr:cytochrome c [Bacteroidales bacterium]